MSCCATTTATIVNVYPLSHDRDQLDGHVKTIHIVRHAQGSHNVNKEYKDIRHLDARLTDYGLQQCASLASKALIPENNDAMLVVTSTMTRCIQTALYSFPNVKRFLAHDSIRETVNFACDRRRLISELQQDHPTVDFSHVKVHEDELWNSYDRMLGHDYNGHRESAQLYKVVERGREFLQWLKGREETEVVVCSHEAFLRCILNWGQDGGVPLMPEQHLDDRGEYTENVPLFRYCGNDREFEAYMRRSYDHCELRSFLMTFPSNESYMS
jgi:broad specificity phosphatase PhoE